MHTLSIFPRLLDYTILAPSILRFVVGIFLILAGSVRSKSKQRWLAILYVANGLFIIIGLYTQIVVLFAILFILIENYLEKKEGVLSREKSAITFLMIAILLSLMLTGPGIFAFDLPL